MKKLIILAIAVLININLFSQSPNMFNYQAVFTDATAGGIVIFTIYESSATGTQVFTETHNLVAGINFNSSNGLINLQIGNGTGSDDLNLIDWSSNTFFLNVKLEGIDKGTTQFMSVPYAMHAKTAESIVGNVKHYVGELFGGGIIFFVDHSGEHGLIASLDDICDKNGVHWSATGDVEIGSAAQSLTNGVGNTAAIIAQDNTSGYAATLCNSYTHDGFSDWYLPAYLELKTLCNNIFIINKILDNDGDSSTNGLSFVGDDRTGDYWSSTELYDQDALSHLVRKDEGDMEDKNSSESPDPKMVRCIRAF